MKKKEEYFEKYKKNIIGEGQTQSQNQFGKKVLYADWAASGRLYRPIEESLMLDYGPYYGNLHSEGNYLSNIMQAEYNKGKEKVKEHFGADDNYVVLARGYGMTTVCNHFADKLIDLGIHTDRAIVFASEYEHNANFLIWKHKGFQIEILRCMPDGQIDLDYLENILKLYEDKKIIATISACSNVTGIITDVRSISKIVKKHNGIVIVDYTTCAPYSVINIAECDIDALMFSVHKFLGGVSGPGILIAKSEYFSKKQPTYFGGGIVEWVNPWGSEVYVNNIEQREEAGTVGIMQMIRAKLCIEMKEDMGPDNIEKKEKELRRIIVNRMNSINVLMYDNNIENRLPIVSFNFYNKNYIEGVRLLNEMYGIQVRGGCCCASLYGHKILDISQDASQHVIYKLENHQKRDLNYGWIRLSLAPVVSKEEAEYIVDAIECISKI